MTALAVRVWNGAVSRAWYAAGCPSRFPLRRIHAAPSCACDPLHIEAGGYDPACPLHDPTTPGGDAR